MNLRGGAFAALALAVAGCPAGELEGGRYACVAGGAADQCPGNWRCGYEGYCHEIGTPKPYICKVDADCESQWTCGLAAHRDAGECHDPAVGVGYACNTSAQCAGGWHCGPALTCYDRNVKAPVACRADGGDCADGWRCGLDQKCQDTGAGGPYACQEPDGRLNDGWCEQGWRCAPEGTCTDPSQDALTGALKAPKAGTQIHPVESAPPFSQFSLSPTYVSGPGAGRQTLVFVRDGGLVARLLDTRSNGQAADYALGPWAGSDFLPMGSRGVQDSPRLIDEVSRVYQALPDGGGRLQYLEANGSVTTSPYPFNWPATRLAMGSATPDLSPRVLAYTPNDPHYFNVLWGDAFLTDGYEFRTDFPNDLWNFPGNRIVDLASVHFLDRLECVFAVDQRGLWVAQKGFVTNAAGQVVDVTFDFEALEVGPMTNDFCGPPAAKSHRITALTTLGRDWLGTASVPVDGGATLVSLIDLRKLYTRGSSLYYCTTLAGGPCDAATRIPVDLRTGPCPVCSGGSVADFALVGDVAQPHLEVRCAGADGGTTGFVSIASESIGTGCLPSFAQDKGGLVTHIALSNPDHRVGGQVAYVSKTGPYVWSGPTVAQARSDLFDRPAALMARRGTAAGDLVVFDGPDYGVLVPDAGFASRSGFEVVATVAGSPTWVVTSTRSVLELTGAGPIAASPLIGIAGSTVTPFVPPFQAVSTLQGSGIARVLVVSASAAVFSAEMDAVLTGQTPFASVSLKAVAPGPIGSLAFPSKSPAELYLRGYAVTPNGVLRVTAQSPTRWEFTPVALPASLVPREVWFEDKRGRVGFSDGTVYALPSRVPIAPALGDVADYAQACGQQLALTPAGLFRLEPVAGATVGAWRPIALPDGFVERGLANGRIHALDDGVYVFANAGETVRVGFDGCP